MSGEVESHHVIKFEKPLHNSAHNLSNGLGQPPPNNLGRTIAEAAPVAETQRNKEGTHRQEAMHQQRS